ncbi:MAG: tetratricopeptide repeat protein [Bacteroidetes bacterium]|nr:tetratricopeptide repeat protein [Bacteroidota bacterium]
MSLSRKDIIEYKTTLDASRKNEIEMNVIDDDFDRESLDGWSENQVSIQQLKSLDYKIKFNFKFKLFLSITLLTITTLIILLVILNSNDSKKKKSLENEQTLIVKKTAISKDSISFFKELPKKLQIKPSRIKADFEEKALFISNESDESKVINREPIHLPVKNPGKINNSASKRENLAKETYLNELKVIDYRFYRTRPYEKVKNELSGTSADKETNTIEQNNSQNAIEYTYFSYLDKSLNYFSKNKFKTALNRFEVILETYPDDANALFYSAICLYNLNQFELCENRLSQLQNSRFTNFDQEQQWYLLLVYKSLDKNNAFVNLKEKIILENGFYSKSAKSLEF